MRHILKKLARIGSGQQYYQTIITRTPETNAALNIYVIDPSAQQALSYSFSAVDISPSHSPLFTKKIDSRYEILAFPVALTDLHSSAGEVSHFERGTVNAMWYSELNNYFLGLLRRFRIKYTTDKAPSLILLESNGEIHSYFYIYIS